MSFLRRLRNYFLSGLKRKGPIQEDPSRRSFLQAIGWGTALPIGQALTGRQKDLPGVLIEASRYFDDQVNVSLYRYQDLLQLDMTFSGFKLSGDSKSLVRSSSSALVVIYFQPQHLAETAYRESGGGGGSANFDADAALQLNEGPIPNDSLNLPAITYASDRSRLVFDIPASINSIPLTADALLNWGQLSPVINSRATAEAILPIFTGKDNVADYLNVLAAPPAEASKGPSKKQLRAATKDEQQQMNARNIQNQQLAPAIVGKTPKKGQPVLIGIIRRLTPGKTPRPLDPSETSIELPYRLFISPNQFGTWYHELKLKWTGLAAAGAFQTCELWHNRLTASNSAYMTVRALWGVDINGTYNQKPARVESFITALYNDDRHCIVHESSNWGIANFTPQAVQVEQLMLTPLGGWLDGVLQVSRTALANAKIIGSLNLLKWKHLANLARDHYVEVVYAGNMFPFGHEASLVRITQRVAKQNYAYNQQQFFIVINETELKYNPVDSSNKFNSFPFSTIRFVTTVTPPLTPPQHFCNTISDKQDDHQFVPKVNNLPFLFRIIAYDLEGTEVDLEMPLVFLSTDITVDGHGNANMNNINAIIQQYNDTNQKYIQTYIDLRSQKMALTRSQTPGDTRFEAQSATFHAAGVPGQPPGFRPLVSGMEVFIHAVQAITGVNTAQMIVLEDDRNSGTVFASLVTASGVSFNGNSNKTGGSLSPNFSVTALSKLHGAIGGDVNQAKNLSFDPTAFFDSTAKLFGVIDLGQIVQKVSNAAATLNGTTVNSPIPALKTIETTDALITQYTWNAATLTTHDFGFVQFVPASGAPGKLVVETSIYRYKNASQPDTLVVNSYLDDFSVTIAGLAAVSFNRVGFTTGSNAKVDVTIDLQQPPVKFMGALTFVNALQQFIPSNGFSDPPYLDVSDTGVETGYTLALPNIQLGAFTLSNVSFGAIVDLPFTGDPMSVKFNFCQKQQPFTLTISLLGGGGFFAVAFDMHGLLSLEAALEFGAAASLDLGVASGSVSVMGGVYYGMSLNNGIQTSELSGYVKMNGSLSVLGLITASVEFDLTLAADLSGNKVTRVWGEATLTIQVSVFMFSTSVQLQVEREFAGADADPTFEQMVSQNDWQTYCGAFAA
ncbi:MAG TPA: hypothetical protein VG052_15620 [Puia sp.]|jgi:hypothetical protein|nr:hypothetical protein [Puia sp.]